MMTLIVESEEWGVGLSDRAPFPPVSTPHYPLPYWKSHETRLDH